MVLKKLDKIPVTIIYGSTFWTITHKMHPSNLQKKLKLPKWITFSMDVYRFNKFYKAYKY